MHQHGDCDDLIQLTGWKPEFDITTTLRDLLDYWVKKTHGRDVGYAVQRSDGFALAISDNPNGADIYEFQLAAHYWAAKRNAPQPDPAVMRSRARREIWRAALKWLR